MLSAPPGALWARLVLVGEYPEPGLEVAGVRSAPEPQEIPCHCWSLAPQRPTDRKLRGRLTRVMVKPQLPRGGAYASQMWANFPGSWIDFSMAYDSCTLVIKFLQKKLPKEVQTVLFLNNGPTLEPLSFGSPVNLALSFKAERGIELKSPGARSLRCGPEFLSV